MLSFESHQQTEIGAMFTSVLHDLSFKVSSNWRHQLLQFYSPNVSLARYRSSAGPPLWFSSFIILQQQIKGLDCRKLSLALKQWCFSPPFVQSIFLSCLNNQILHTKPHFQFNSVSFMRGPYAINHHLRHTALKPYMVDCPWNQVMFNSCSFQLLPSVLVWLYWTQNLKKQDSHTASSTLQVWKWSVQEADDCIIHPKIRMVSKLQGSSTALTRGRR